ncbi:hypothetical protein LX82_02685 [Celeribacter halophilus]|uniref:Uncharacterized protein n=1 Tax=Celeribacter halophilus TaxID=576117 RepID=A0A1I3XBY4_9RHOB|nr:hypothetical protein LX82_02685 [Celeribacter halophilus]SFK17034.1 hypothetical protein SAMN04488138_1473 [Celeribacter halophilus]
MTRTHANEFYFDRAFIVLTQSKITNHIESSAITLGERSTFYFWAISHIGEDFISLKGIYKQPEAIRTCLRKTPARQSKLLTLAYTGASLHKCPDAISPDLQ